MSTIHVQAELLLFAVQGLTKFFKILNPRKSQNTDRQGCIKLSKGFKDGEEIQKFEKKRKENF